MKTLKYSDGWKFRTEEPLSVPTGIVLPAAIGNSFVALDLTGTLYIAKGYAWDGASGPVPDTRNSIIATAAHDGLYQLHREGLLPLSYRRMSDDVFYNLLVGAGMWPPIAAVYHRAVDKFGLKHALPCDPVILEAP